MASCGDLKECIQDYARHSTFIAPAAQDDGQCSDCTNLLKNRMVVYNDMENIARFGILQSLQGVRGCKTLKARLEGHRTAVGEGLQDRRVVQGGQGAPVSGGHIMNEGGHVFNFSGPLQGLKDPGFV